MFHTYSETHIYVTMFHTYSGTQNYVLIFHTYYETHHCVHSFSTQSLPSDTADYTIYQNRKKTAKTLQLIFTIYFGVIC
jgi:hypothetical protein